jgi:hypothetical protein
MAVLLVCAYKNPGPILANVNGCGITNCSARERIHAVLEELVTNFIASQSLGIRASERGSRAAMEARPYVLLLRH